VEEWDAIAASGLALWMLAMAWSLGTTFAALAQPLKRRRVGWPESRPAVSVIVPVSSHAPALPVCVESLAQLDYPAFEVILCAAQDDRAAAEAVRVARQEYPALRACFVVPAAIANPKSALLEAAVREAKHDLLLLTDDNVVSSPVRIQTHLCYQEAGYGLVSACALGYAAENFWGAVDAAFMNGHFARLQLAGDAIGLSFTTGKSIMVSRVALERSGGYVAAGETVCEDAIVQRQLETVGQRPTLSHEPVLQPIGRRNHAEVWHRHLRWTACRRRYAPLLFALELVASAPVAALAGGLASAGLGVGFVTGIIVTPVLQLGIEWAFLTFAHCPRGIFYPAVWAARELLSLPLWVAALLPRRATVWRERSLDLRP
jgi:ceramide glucosyltransferase